MKVFKIITDDGGVFTVGGNNIVDALLSCGLPIERITSITQI